MGTAARKLVPPVKKWDAVLRILEGKSDTGNEARRLGVTQKAVQAWRREYLEVHPEAKRLEMKPAPPPPPPPPSSAPKELYKDFRPAGDAPLAKAAGASSGAGGPQPTPGLIDTAALKKAMEADGRTAIVGPTPGAPQPPVLTAVSMSSEAEDMAIVEGVANQLMGWTMRLLIFALEQNGGVTIEVTERLQRLYILTDTEKAALKPASRHLAFKIRELIGSDEKVAYVVGGSTVGSGLLDRGRIVGADVARAMEVKKAKDAAEAK